MREDAGLRVRLPLAGAVVAGHGAEDLAPLAELLADEINVKKVELTGSLADHAAIVLRPSGSMLGPRLGAAVQDVFKAARAGDWRLNDDGTANVAGHELDPDSFELTVQVAGDGAAARLASGDAVVVLDTAVTAELQAEGWARDAVRMIQDCRRAEGLIVTDRIEVLLELASAEQAAAVEQWRDYVAEQVLATNLKVTTAGTGKLPAPRPDPEVAADPEAAGTGNASASATDASEPRPAGFAAHHAKVDGKPASCYLKPVKR